MFGLFTASKNRKLQEKLNVQEEKIKKLEESMELMLMNLTNLQTAILANSRCQESINYDITRIGELISAVLENSDLELGFPGPGEDSGPGNGTIH